MLGIISLLQGNTFKIYFCRIDILFYIVVNLSGVGFCGVIFYEGKTLFVHETCVSTASIKLSNMVAHLKHMRGKENQRGETMSKLTEE